jgi:hypothetical protein
MKKTVTTIIITAIFFGGLFAQDSDKPVPGLLDEAKSSYNSGDLENSRFALQQALNEINRAIGNDMLALMPESLGDMTVVEDGDNVTGMNAGFAGLFVNRSYKGETTAASVEIVSDSPLLGSINILLSMPVFIATDPNQKRIKVDGKKALLTKSEDELAISYDVQLVFDDTLFTFHTIGVNSEDEVVTLLEKFPVTDIINVAR